MCLLFTRSNTYVCALGIIAQVTGDEKNAVGDTTSEVHQKPEGFFEEITYNTLVYLNVQKLLDVYIPSWHPQKGAIGLYSL